MTALRTLPNLALQSHSLQFDGCPSFVGWYTRLRDKAVFHAQVLILLLLLLLLLLHCSLHGSVAACHCVNCLWRQADEQVQEGEAVGVLVGKLIVSTAQHSIGKGSTAGECASTFLQAASALVLCSSQSAM